MKIIAIIILTALILILIYFAFTFYTMRGVAVPDYTIVKKDHAIEIREYKPMLIAEVETKGNRDEAANQGFRILASYIFGNNTTQENASEKINMIAPVMQSSEKIKMTAPVITQPSEKIKMTVPVMQTPSNNNHWLVKFVMPEKYTLKTLPKPNNNAISIHQLPSGKMVTIRFSGIVTPKKIAQQVTKLRGYIQAHHLKAADNYQLAMYNPPWTLPFMRRNEILIQLK